MRILFVLRASGFLRNFEGVIREMRRRGHDVTVAVEVQSKGDARYTRLADELIAEGVSFVVAPTRKRRPPQEAAVQVRLGLDYLRYLDGGYTEDSKLRARAAGAAPPLVRRLAEAPGLSSRAGRAALRRGLRALDAAAPVAPGVHKFLAAQKPDVLLVTPLVELGAPQTDWLRAARELGIPTALGVASWDNLTVKGELREWPDRVLVWNDAQVREASEIHGVPAERVTATGAHTYDHWFAWRPSRDRTTFCAEAGLRADRPFLLYLCSSPFIAPGEAEFVREWIAGLRASRHAELREAGVLVRPHPQHALQWADTRVDDLGDAVVWPPAGADPVEETSRNDFFDSMAHCAAVVGVNTSAQIESAIAGRDVLTLLDGRFAATQGGTLHFSHLAREDGGLLQVARTREEHHDQLRAVLRGETDSAARRARFLRHFVRPHGLDVAAAPAFVAAVEAIRPAGGPPAPASPAVLRGLDAVWRSVPWSPLMAVLSPSQRHKTLRRLDKRLKLVRSLSLRRPHPPRTVAELQAPARRSLRPRPAGARRRPRAPRAA